MSGPEQQTVRVTGLSRLKNRLDPLLKGPLRSLARLIYQPLARRTPVTLFIGNEPLRFQYGSQPTVVDGMLPFEHRIFAGAIQPGQTVVDVGAHLGAFTVLAGLRVGARGWVASFEPTEASRRVLSANIRLNRYEDRTEIVGAVAGDHAGPVDFYTRGVDSTNRIFAPDSDEPEYTRRTVPMVRLDDFFASSRPRPDLVKIDVEGAEFAVLRGAEKIMATGARILCEIHPYEWERAGHSAGELVEWLRARNRSMVWLGTTEVVAEFRYGNTELVPVA
jgi:FkbM family methyltransferase